MSVYCRLKHLLTVRYLHEHISNIHREQKTSQPLFGSDTNPAHQIYQLLVRIQTHHVIDTPSCLVSD